MTALSMAKAINAGLRRSLADDDRVVLMGEDIGTLGGVFRVTDGLQTEFGPRRVMDSPLAESGILGTAVGMAYRGLRPVVEIQFDGFIYPAFDQIVSQVARMHYRTAGAVRMPITIRVPFAGGIGAAEHHSDSPEAYFAHAAGLRVVSPSTPQDARRTRTRSSSRRSPRTTPCCSSSRSAATTRRATSTRRPRCRTPARWERPAWSPPVPTSPW